MSLMFDSVIIRSLLHVVGFLLDDSSHLEKERFLGWCGEAQAQLFNTCCFLSCGSSLPSLLSSLTFLSGHSPWAPQSCQKAQAGWLWPTGLQLFQRGYSIMDSSQPTYQSIAVFFKCSREHLKNMPSKQLTLFLLRF